MPEITVNPARKAGLMTEVTFIARARTALEQVIDGWSETGVFRRMINLIARRNCYFGDRPVRIPLGFTGVLAPKCLSICLNPQMRCLRLIRRLE